jgi:hypothetical protein
VVYRRVRNYGNTMGATSGAETANSSRPPEYTSRCYLDSCYSIFSFLFIILSIAVCPFFFAHCVVRTSILITPLGSSNSSCNNRPWLQCYIALSCRIKWLYQDMNIFNIINVLRYLMNVFKQVIVLYTHGYFLSII